MQEDEGVLLQRWKSFKVFKIGIEIKSNEIQSSPTGYIFKARKPQVVLYCTGLLQAPEKEAELGVILDLRGSPEGPRI